ncbi:hypothetical protein [Brasilonema bromeliae]|uniref:Chromosome partitioning protein, ParB family n=1 Tax=Brasilonema bromeliae SPC951 TaxID=385972 RepID=A0ABX1PAT9_9CYAN|nr:hypothetical protein [Brasilonema bromeliae]NMG21550.1 hypothetical protein [Brasilonema bromeliae SPC951]
MELLTSIVDIDSIQVKSPPFAPAQKTTQIDALANTIIELGGLVNVPVVQQVSVDDYELISGYLEYYAYLKACELNPRLPDRITVFVSNTKNQAAIRQQLEILQVIEDTKQNSSQSITPKQSEIDLQIKNLESSINNNNKIIFNALEQLKADLLATIEAKLPQPISPMDSFNRILEPETAFQVQRKLELFLGASKAKKVVVRLQEVSKGKKNQPFQRFSEILDILREQQKGRSQRLISEEKMIQIIDRWND